MRIWARRHNAVSKQALLAILRLAPPHPDLADLESLEILRDTPRGTTLRGRRRGETWSVVIKLFTGPQAATQAEALHEKHRYVFACCRTQQTCSVPEPLGMLNDPPGYAMRYVGGRSGVSMLRTAIFRRQRTAEELVGRAGSWLRAFHLGSGLSLAPLRAGSLIALVEKRLDGGGSATAFPHRDAFAEHVALLRETLPMVRGQPVPVAAHHGDFNLHNMIFDGQNTWSFDFSGAAGRMRPAFADVACFQFFLEFRDRWRVTDRRDSPGGFDARAIEVFARAYPELPWHSTQAAWLLLQYQLRYWSSMQTPRKLARADRMLEACAHGAETLRSRVG